MSDHFEIVVPSHGRAELLKGRTLRLLDRLGLPATIVVAEEDWTDYRRVIPSRWPIEVGQIGLAANRDAVAKLFPAGTNVLSMDDDLLAIKSVHVTDGSWYHLGTDEFKRLASMGFWLLNRFDGAIWGLNPTGDRRFLWHAPDFSVGAMPIEGCLYGFVAGRANLSVPESSFDDMERIAQVWYDGWNLVRFNRVCYIQSKSGVGGKAAEHRLNQCDEVNRIVNRYPRIAVHTFGKLPNQSKCRVSIRPRSSIRTPTRADVDALRAKILESPCPAPPPLHDAEFVPDVESRARETAAALRECDEAVWSLLAGSYGGHLGDFVAAAVRYIGATDKATAADELRRAALRVRGPKPGDVEAVQKAVERFRTASRLMDWKVTERPAPPAAPASQP